CKCHCCWVFLLFLSKLTAVYESTTQVYIICNIEGLFRVNINLIDVKENISILTKESLYIMGSFNGE
ncbi:hypothetical protein, partial [Thermovenabulum sp.]|uniref:hypothetical protein n=1 Tax=Thermovenabulum sp. TaxID=3100335 RepID=UPI003C7D3BC0